MAISRDDLIICIEQIIVLLPPDQTHLEAALQRLKVKAAQGNFSPGYYEELRVILADHLPVRQNNNPAWLDYVWHLATL